MNRKQFILKTGKGLGFSLFFSFPFVQASAKYLKAQQTITVGNIIDDFISQVDGAPFSNTVDTLKSGDRNIKVTGIVTTMFATIPVIKTAIDIGANFIIAHEPTFYNHTDETDWLKNSEVYQYKEELLRQHKISIWRNHDYIHSLKVDGVGLGVLKQLQWEKYYRPDLGNVLMLPDTSLADLIGYLKKNLSIEKVRYEGNLQQNCRKVLFLPGSAGGKRQISELIKTKPDVLVCGEIQEWETAEYIRDAQAQGDQVSLIVLGHIASEEPGSEFMLNWLKERYPAIKSTHIPAGNSLAFM